MQEEIENRTVTLIISAVKLTARELKAGMDKYLSEKKSKAMEKARAAPEKPSGKQTVRQLIGQNQGVSNIEITNSNRRAGGAGRRQVHLAASGRAPLPLG